MVSRIGTPAHSHVLLASSHSHTFSTENFFMRRELQVSSCHFIICRAATADLRWHARHQRLGDRNVASGPRGGHCLPRLLDPPDPQAAAQGAWRGGAPSRRPLLATAHRRHPHTRTGLLPPRFVLLLPFTLSTLRYRFDQSS